MVYKNFSKYDIDVENGTVFSNAFNKKKMLKTRITADGYVSCGVQDDFGNWYYRLHQIVYCAVNGITKSDFPTDENGFRYEIDHIDGNKQNNCIDNLKLVSKKENMNNPLVRKFFSEKVKNESKETRLRRRITCKNKLHNEDKRKKVARIDKDTNEILEIYSSMTEAHRKQGYSITSISDCCLGKQVIHKGYKWQFVA